MGRVCVCVCARAQAVPHWKLLSQYIHHWLMAHWSGEMKKFNRLVRLAGKEGVAVVAAPSPGHSAKSEGK